MASETKWAVVTGANRGIGLELTRQLSAGGYSVVAGCRAKSDGLAALAADAAVTIVEGVDVTKAEGVEALRAGTAAAVGDAKVALLVNNAGILHVDDMAKLGTDDGVADVELQFRVNAVAPLRVANALLPLIASPGGKIAFITSRMGSIADNGSGGMYGYRMSKAALNMGATSMAKDLQKAEKGIAVAILHPGMVETDMTARFGGGIPPAESVAGLLARIDGLTLENSGTFWHQNGEVLPW